MVDRKGDVKALAETLAAIGGCSDGDCKVLPPRGMHTNGGCRCMKDQLKAGRVILAYRAFVGRAELMDARPEPEYAPWPPVTHP